MCIQISSLRGISLSTSDENPEEYPASEYSKLKDAPVIQEVQVQDVTSADNVDLKLQIEKAAEEKRKNEYTV